MDTNKYSNGKIYKIVHNDGRCYIGSTIKTLEQRLHFHHWHYNKYLKNEFLKEKYNIFKGILSENNINFFYGEEEDYFIKLNNWINN